MISTFSSSDKHWWQLGLLVFSPKIVLDHHHMTSNPDGFAAGLCHRLLQYQGDSSL